ncbi:MAG: PIG-L family deacetylase [Bryobacteraceae bacterium]
MNILAIGPHPDDIEFGCAPILLKEIRKGNRVNMLILSRGESGTAGSPDVREHESRKAAACMGAAIDFLDLGGDCHFEHTPANAFKIAAFIRRSQPDIVITPHPDQNQHPDHVVAARLTRDACRFARYGGVAELLDQPVHFIKSLFFYHITQHLSRPDLIIDISDVEAAWEEVMKCHETQLKNKSYLELQTTAARLLGLTIGVEYAAGLYLSDPLRLESISEIQLSSRNF